MSTVPDLCNAALEYAARGWPVLPCHSAPGGKCSCDKFPCGTANRKAGKHPRTLNGVKDATTDVNQITAWAMRYSGCNWAVATGPESGIFALDVDGATGRASLAVLETQYGPLPTTLVSLTGRADGGEHRVFRYPVGRMIRCDSGNNGGKLGKGLDVRGAGGYVIVYPSIHASGNHYTWQTPDVPIADAPNWLLDLLSEEETTGRTRSNGARIPMGQRTPTLFREGCSLRGRRGATQAEIEAHLLQMNAERCDPPHGESRIKKLAQQICAQYPPGTIWVKGSQPLPEFLEKARQKNNLEFLIRNQRAKWSSALFTFTRLVKGRAEFAGMDAYQAAARIDQENIPQFWDQFTIDKVSADPRMQFQSEWDAVRSPAGDGDTLTRAWIKAQQQPVVVKNPYSTKYTEFIAVLYQLQIRAGKGNPVPVPQSRFGIMLGVDRTMIGNYLKAAARNQLVHKSKDYVKREIAAEYILDLSKVELVSSVHSPQSHQKQQTPQDPPDPQDSIGGSADSGENETQLPPRYDDGVEQAALIAGREWAAQHWDESCELSSESLAREAAMASLSQGAWEVEQWNTAQRVA